MWDASTCIVSLENMTANKWSRWSLSRSSPSSSLVAVHVLWAFDEPGNSASAAATTDCIKEARGRRAFQKSNPRWVLFFRLWSPLFWLLSVTGQLVRQNQVPMVTNQIKDLCEIPHRPEKTTSLYKVVN